MTYTLSNKATKSKQAAVHGTKQKRHSTNLAARSESVLRGFLNKAGKKQLSIALSVVLTTVSPQMLYGNQTAAAPPGETGPPTQAAPMSTAQLQALVAPIALYPDSLIAQILTGATFPDQVAVASYWLEQNKSLTGASLMQAVDKQTWDASVKALTEFPSVLDNLAKNLTWTSSLGEAYHDQQAEVMTAIQTLRAQAKTAGNLKSSSQITVVQQAPQTIVIQPANPQIVYVPQYNPAVIYGTPYVTPGYSAGDVAAAGIIGFGAGIAVGAMMSGGCCGWGYSSWNCGWHGTAVVYHGGAYYGNSAWHGGSYSGGYHGSYGYSNSYAHNSYNSYNHNTNVSGNTVNVNTNNAQNFNKTSAQNVNKSSAQNFSNEHSSASNSFAQHDAGGADKGSSSGFGGSGGWSSKADSSRGWGSMKSSGFSGGRFGGGGSGGGGFHGGGGFRR
ncbi:MAG TPA: DUF3300 domain-containing protein [Bryobacteraceae bacterium]|jgi:hypothetical protein|nr:DUF3300 domain-containing protein [Bryobacteraceae bacterium]